MIFILFLTLADSNILKAMVTFKTLQRDYPLVKTHFDDSTSGRKD